MFLEVLDFLLELYVFVFVLELALPFLLVATAEHRFLLKVSRLEVFAQLVDLPVQRINHLVLGLNDVLELDLFGKCLVDLVRFLFHLQVHLLVFLGAGLALELASLDLALLLSELIFEVFDLAVEGNELVVFVDLERVSFPPYRVALLVGFLSSSFGLLQVSPQLFNQVTVTAVIALLVERLVFQEQLINFTSEFLLDVIQVLLSFVFKRVKLAPRNIKLPLGLVVLVLKPLDLGGLLVDLYSMPGLNILHDLHPENVCVYRQCQLLSQLVDLSLFYFNEPLGVAESAFKIDFNFFALLDFFSEAALVSVDLLLLLLVVELEVVVQLVDLLSLDCANECE